MTELTLTRTDVPTLWRPRDQAATRVAAETVCSFLDTATTSFGRATHYNTRLEQQKAELKAHEGLFQLERDLYVALMVLPGTTDRARQIGLKKLLSTPRDGQGAFLSGDQEREVLHHLVQALPASRMLKLLDALRQGNRELGIPRANNARTRKLILRTLISSPRLQLWAVKYRSKMRRALTHAWGQRMASIIRSILSKPPEDRDDKENSILDKNLVRFADASGDVKKANERIATALQSVGFVLGLRDRLTLPLLRAFEEAKTDLSKGKRLPPEVLEGIRGTYHKDTPKEKIIHLTARTMTKGQKVAVQKRAKKAGVKVDADFMSQDAVRLYIYAFENGMTDEVRAALKEKAKKAAKQFPLSYKCIGIVVDASRSMFGDKTQKLRPMAATLALRDMLEETVTTGAKTVYCGGECTGHHRMKLVRPMGDTALADGLMSMFISEDRPEEAIFVLSDGYENAPAGRFAEVVHALREIGIDTPIYHLNPVFAAESTGVRELAPGLAPTLPVREPRALGTTIVRGMIEADPVKGINLLIGMALTEGPTNIGLLTG